MLKLPEQIRTKTEKLHKTRQKLEKQMRGMKSIEKLIQDPDQKIVYEQWARIVDQIKYLYTPYFERNRLLTPELYAECAKYSEDFTDFDDF